MNPLPCPFCGKIPSVDFRHPVEVSCLNAKCPAMPYVFDVIEENDTSGLDVRRQATIKRWNKRKKL